MIRRWWNRLLHWLFDGFLEEHLSRERALLQAAFLEIQKDLEDAEDSRLQFYFKTRRLEEKISQEVVSLANGIRENQEIVNSRTAQMLALYHGKTPREWKTPVRAPKVFSVNDKQ